jgi:hypothetical protein
VTKPLAYFRTALAVGLFKDKHGQEPTHGQRKTALDSLTKLLSTVPIPADLADFDPTAEIRAPRMPQDERTRAGSISDTSRESGVTGPGSTPWTGTHTLT